MSNSTLIASSNGKNYVKVGRGGHVYFNSPKEEEKYYVPYRYFKFKEGRRNAVKCSILFLSIVDRNVQKASKLLLKCYGMTGFSPSIHKTKSNSLPIKN